MIARTALFVGAAWTLVACEQSEPPDLVESLTVQLSAREREPVDVLSIHQMKAGGQDVVCGFFGARPKAGGWGLHNRYFAAEGRLADEDDKLFATAAEACFAKIETRLPAVP